MHHRAGAGVVSQSGWGWGGLLGREGALQTCKPSQREATNLKLENSTLIAMPSSQSVRQAVQRGTASSGTLVEFRSFSLRPGDLTPARAPLQQGPTWDHQSIDKVTNLTE